MSSKLSSESAIKPLKFLVISGSLAVLLGGCQPTEFDPGQPNPASRSITNPVTDLQTQLGIGYLREGKPELAWERLNKALEYDPNYSVANNAMGLLYEQLGQPVKAEQHYQRAVSANPGDSSAQNNYGRFLCRDGRYEDGEKHLMMAVQNTLYDTPEVAYTNAGICAKASGDPVKADTYFRKALESSPTMAVALINMAELSYDQGNALSARAYIQRYLEVAQHTPQSLWLGIQIEKQLGDREAMANYGVQLKTRFPDSPETKLLLEGSPQ